MTDKSYLAPELSVLPPIDDFSSIGYNPSVLVQMGIPKPHQNRESLSAFQRYEQFPYDDWKPPRQRIEFVNRYALGTSLIDIACGGHPVSSEVDIIYNVGVDISPKARELSAGKFKQFYALDFEATPIEELQRILGKYDTVVASEFLEHTFNPGLVIEKLVSLMYDDGRLLVTVPNGESLAGRVDKLRNHGQWKRFSWFHKNHVSLLPLSAWRKLFTDAGLEEAVFDFRPSDIIEGFPKETTPGWKPLCSLAPRYLAHQYFFVLEKS